MNTSIILAALLCMVATVHAVTIGPTTYTITSTATDFTKTITVAKFDSSLGTLNSITTTVSLPISSILTVSNSAAAGSNAAGNVKTQVGLTLDTQGGNSPFDDGYDTVVSQTVDTSVYTPAFTYSGLVPGASTTSTAKVNPAGVQTRTSVVTASSGVTSGGSDPNVINPGTVGDAAAFFTEMQAVGGGSDTWTINSFTSTVLTNTGGNVQSSQATTGAVTITVQYDYTAGATGDPQIVGFQGQRFQIHGTPDEYYNLVSSSSYYMNSRFVYMASGICNYNDTECFSHAGTYIGEIGFVSGVNRVRVTSGPHAVGLSVHINDMAAHIGARAQFDNSTSVRVISRNRVTITTSDFTIMVVNSDLFLNLAVDFTNSPILHAGKVRVVVPAKATPSDADKLISTSYPEFAMHGLLGQTWRNIVWPNSRLYQGEPLDYLVTSMFSSEFVYTQYQA